MSATELNAFLADAFPTNAVAYRVVEVTGEGAILHLPVGPEHERPGGTVSGPTMMTLADAAAWVATLTRIGPVPLAVTSSLTISFLRKPALTADLWATGTLLKLGRHLSVTDVRIGSGAGGDLVAQSTVTYAIPASTEAGRLV